MKMRMFDGFFVVYFFCPHFCCCSFLRCCCFLRIFSVCLVVYLPKKNWRNLLRFSYFALAHMYRRFCLTSFYVVLRVIRLRVCRKCLFFSFCFRCSLENVPEKNLRSSSFFPSVYIENQTANIWSKMNIVFFLACSHIFLGFFHGPTRLSCTFVELFYLKTNFFVHHETQHKQINKTQWETKATQQYKRKDANKNIANH